MKIDLVLEDINYKLSKKTISLSDLGIKLNQWITFQEIKKETEIKKYIDSAFKEKYNLVSYSQGLISTDITAHFYASQTHRTLHLSYNELGHTKKSWNELSKSDQQDALEEYWNGHRDSIIYWNLES